MITITVTFDNGKGFTKKFKKQTKFVWWLCRWLEGYVWEGYAVAKHVSKFPKDSREGVR